MGAKLYDTACTQRLLLREEGLEEFKTLADRMYGPLNWQETDDRISASEDGLLSVKPLDRYGCSFLSGSRPHFYDDDIGLILSLCEPGSVVEVLDGETGFFEQFSIDSKGDLRRRRARLVNPFRVDPAS